MVGPGIFKNQIDIGSEQKAGVPVVVCKVGKSEESARMARTHTGDLAGSSAAYEAALNECGAISVDTVDQLLNVARWHMQLTAGVEMDEYGEGHRS